MPSIKPKKKRIRGVRLPNGSNAGVGGRPAKYIDPEVMREKINEYFESGANTRKVLIGPANNKKEIEVKVPTITGLSNFLGFEDRDSFYNYSNDRPEFSHVIKYARNRIASVYEEQLSCGYPAGAIFALKNFGWVDKTEVDHQGNINITTFVDGLRSINGKRYAQSLESEVNSSIEHQKAIPNRNGKNGSLNGDLRHDNIAPGGTLPEESRSNE